MSDSNNTVEVSSPIGEYIVASEWSKHSEQGAAEHSLNSQQAEAEAAKSSDSDRNFGDTLKQAIRDQKPILSEQDLKDIEAEKGVQQEAESEEEPEVEEEPEQEEAELSLLDKFSPEAVEKLAEQFGLSEEDLQSPAVQRMLADRLEGSEQVQQNEVKAPQTEAQRTQEQYQAHFAELQRISTDPNIFDPVIVDATVRGLADCFGAETPEEIENVQKLSAILGMAGVNLASQIVPQIVSHYFNEYLEQAAPGLMETHRSAVAHNTWSDLKASNPDYANLPNVDSPEFNELREKVLAENPWLTSIQYKDANGKVLNDWHPQAVRQSAALFAKLAVGQRLTQETAQKFIEAGKRQAEGHQRRVTASKSLKGGRSIGMFQPVKGNDFLDAIMAYNKSQRSSEDKGE